MSDLVERLKSIARKTGPFNHRVVLCKAADHIKQQDKRIAELEAVERALKFTVLGWREWDWPEGFDRRTAQLIADAVSQQIAKQEKDNAD